MNQTTIAVIAVGALALFMLSQKNAAQVAAPSSPYQPTPPIPAGKGAVGQPAPSAVKPPDIGGLINTAQQAWNDPNVQSAVNWLGGIWGGITGGGSRSVYA